MSSLPVHPGADAVLEALDPEQREVAAHPLGPMCVLAGAGTGKTRAITHRIAHGVLAGAYQPQRVLAVTFTARAAGEMRTRLRDLGVGGVQARTFHAAALRQLHYFWPQAVGGAAPEVMPHKAGAVAEAAGRLRLRLDSPGVRDVAAEVEWAKVSMLTAETYAAEATRLGREPPAGLDATATARLVAEYEQVKGERGVIDFEDVLLLMAGVLGEHEEVARAVRSQYRHFVVDEYQDVNRLQQTLLELWLGGREDVCVVGDPSQTIYSFTGASPEHLLGFRSRHPNARVVELVRNYRSTPAGGPARQPRPAHAGRRAARRRRRAPGPARGRPAPRAARRRRRPRRGPAGRRPGQPRHRRRPLTGRGRRPVPHQRAERGLRVRPRRASASPTSSAAASASSPARRSATPSLLLRGAARSDDGSVPLPDLVRDVLLGAGWTREPPTGGGATRERWESLAALAALADDVHATDPEALLPGLRPRARRACRGPARPDRPGGHPRLAARRQGPGVGRGLPRRLLRRLPPDHDGRHPRGHRGGAATALRRGHPGPARSSSSQLRPGPHPRAPGPRAGRRASSTRTASRARRGRPEPAEAPAHRRGAGRRDRPRPARRAGSAAAAWPRRRSARSGGAPPARRRWTRQLFEALRGWRLETARAADVPAFVVFTDATLTAIAERAPADTRELSRIPGVGPAKLERFGEAVLDDPPRLFLRPDERCATTFSRSSPAESAASAEKYVATPRAASPKVLGTHLACPPGHARVREQRGGLAR